MGGSREVQCDASVPSSSTVMFTYVSHCLAGASYLDRRVFRAELMWRHCRVWARGVCRGGRGGYSLNGPRFSNR